MIITSKVLYRRYCKNNGSMNMDQIKCEILNEFEPSVNIQIKPDKIGVSSLDPNRWLVFSRK